MATVLGVKTLQETKLWKRLEKKISTEGDLAKRLAANLPQICDEASNRAKRFAGLHPPYTLHDEVHFLRVAELIGYLIPDEVELNSVELALLILSAHFHDQGMVLEDAELTTLESDPQFQLFKNNWIVEHPNYREISQRSIDSRLSDDERKKCRDLENELSSALFTDYVRITHGKRSAQFVGQQYNHDKRLEVLGVNFASHLARLCISHTIPVDELSPQLKLAYDESVGPLTVNMVYLAIALRLADLLDFDRERTPDELFRTIHFTSSISLLEWAKHRAVEGWVISPKQIRFTVNCTHPAYHRAILRFMDYIDAELSSIHSALRSFPAAVSKYILPLPEKVDRSRIQAKDDAYEYHDLEFTLSRDEIVKLLMTESLYQSPSLCVRELLQNSLDALRHRRALLKRDEKVDWTEGKVFMEHALDASGREVLRCIDNGIGMDEEIITRFLVRAGRSYYRSPEFELERASLAVAKADFDPCARFGIGFMSCFMLGDEIKILTRRYYGTHKPIGKPLEVEIHGLSGLVVIRRGKDDQPIGTTVEIRGRVKPGFFDEWHDKVRLLDVLDGYALATEFPIEAKCLVPEIAGELRVPITIKKPKTFLEELGASLVRNYEQDFSVIDPRLRGTIKTSLLVDENGKLVSSNAEAEWFQSEKTGIGLIQRIKDKKITWHGDRDSATCLDGILVCGYPGRIRECEGRLGHVANWINTGRDEFILDVRGKIKPNLDPARHPLGSSRMDADETWLNLQSMVDSAHGLLWEQILGDFGDLAAIEMFWQNLIFNGISPAMMRAGVIWDKLLFPVCGANGSNEWKRLEELRKVWFENDVAGGFQLAGGGIVKGFKPLSSWLGQQKNELCGNLIVSALVPMGTLCPSGNRLAIEFSTPENPNIHPWNQIWRQRFGGWTFCLPYAGELREVLSAYGPVETLNWHHPLTKLALELKFVNKKSDFQIFIGALARCLSSKDTLDTLLDPKYKIHPQDRWRKYIANTFLSLDWSQISPELRPPYKVWLPDLRVIALDEAEFKRWASA
jgi:hypothetical protein